VKEFAPRLSFGCSISSLPHLALNLLNYPAAQANVINDWQNMATYYAMIFPQGKGKVMTIPGMRDPIVKYKLANADYANLRDGLNKLAKILIASGAIELFPSVAGIQKWTRDPESIVTNFCHNQMFLMTIHLFSSCPMGENQHRCVVNSFGKVHGHENLYISDGSILPTAIGVNPQGSIMAFARRNTIHYLNGH
jgi:choline dehydrogenase-like flavoprotein